MSKCKCHSELVEAKAQLEYIKNLPTGAFRTVFGSNGTIITYAVDSHQYAIQMARARVKRLEVLAGDK